MKAAVLRAPQVLELGDIATPEAAPGELVLRVRAATVCGTDLRILTGRKTKGVRFPSVIGHEFAGEVVQTGDGVTQFKTGDRVCMDPVVARPGRADFKTGEEKRRQAPPPHGDEFFGALGE